MKFDTYHPAVDRGLPVTRVISRVVLQNILAEACKELAGDDVISNGSNVVKYVEEVRGISKPAPFALLHSKLAVLPRQQRKCAAIGLLAGTESDLVPMQEDPVTGKPRVVAFTDNGERYEGDILIGADGIHSKVHLTLTASSCIYASCLPDNSSAAQLIHAFTVISAARHGQNQRILQASSALRLAVSCRSDHSYWALHSHHTASTLATLALQISRPPISTQLAIVCSWATGSTLSAAMLAAARCSGTSGVTLADKNPASNLQLACSALAVMCASSLLPCIYHHCSGG